MVIQYVDKKVHQQILDYFEKKNIDSFSTEYRIDIDLDSQKTVHIQHYTLNIPTKTSIFEIIEVVSLFDSVTHVSSQKND